MKFVLFYHSLISDWNHGNAHFLRGVVRALLELGHEVQIYEPADGWSRSNLVQEYGPRAVEEFEAAFPGLSSMVYELGTLDLDAALDGADVVIVHEWNAPELVARLGRRRAAGGRFRLLFHDTHHRAVSRPQEIAAFRLDAYDGVLAFGEVIRELYLRQGWSRCAWTWHEAADTALFKPARNEPREGDLVWIGNWGDSERSAELKEYLVEPIRRLRLRAAVYGVRYPEQAKSDLRSARADYRGWLPNYRVPEIFSRFLVTLHVPRRPYARALPGIPTIRVFEALACGIPLVCAPWDDVEGLFSEADFLRAGNGAEMQAHLRALAVDSDLRAELSRNGLRTIEARHTCRHRAQELLSICRSLDLAAASLPGHVGAV